MIPIVRSIAAVIVGYATIVVGAIVFQEVLFGGISYSDSPRLDLVVGGGLTAMSAVAGGYLLAVVAPGRPMLHAIPVALWLSAETTFLYVSEITAGPLWFDIVSGATLVVGVFIGVIIYTRLTSASSSQPEARPTPS